MSPVRPFTPTREDPEVLDRRTVGADTAAILDRIVSRIEAACRGNLAHTLVVGPRGAGKTHILAVARHRADLLVEGTAVRSVAVPEDGHGIVTYVELLRFVARSVGVDVAALGEVARDVGGLESAILDRLAGGVLVLVVENLDRLFAKLGTAGQHDLRAWVETTRKVLLLASSPLLFDGVRDRNEPWFGSFTTEYLTELTADEGSELLLHLRPDDVDLAEFLASPTGQARIHALHLLTGGSPRLWTIFADVVTVDLLDDLVPAVERLLEELVTYYQQRLWDLGPNEERVVTALASGPASRTATQLAAELGLDQRTMGTTMGRLAEAKVVRGQKIPGTDQRSTWYELREPLLRHYLQYRTDDRRELTLIVEMLRHWFDPAARERHLLETAPGSQAERYLGASLNLDWPVAYDDAYESNSAEGLLLQARRWTNDPHAPPGFSDAGVVLEGVLGRLRTGGRTRPMAPPLRDLVDAVGVVAHDSDESAVADALDRLATAASGRLTDIFRWLAAGWRISSDPRDAERRLRALRSELTDDDDLLAVHVSHDLAYLQGMSNPDEAITALQEVLSRRRRLQGDRHPDTLLARSNLAGFIGDTGDAAGALHLYEELLPDQADALGPHHRHTLATRYQIAYYTGETGDAAGALDLYRDLLPDQADVLGPHHRHTLATRSLIAYYTGATGDAAGALDLYRDLLPDRIDALGSRHRGTLATRYQIAYYTGETGDAAGALDLYRDLLPDQADVLGPHHRDTLITRSLIAYYTGATGDAAGALDLYRDLLPDQADALGRRHRDTLATRYRIAYYTGETGDAAGALDLYRDLLSDQADVLGPHHRDTLITRYQNAYLTGQTGDATGALRSYRDLLPDQIDALGPRHRDTLLTRAEIAYYTGQTGDAGGALDLYRDLLPDQADVLGARHWQTLVTRLAIAKCELALGQPVEAFMTAWHVAQEETPQQQLTADVRGAVEGLVGASMVEVITRRLTRALPEEVRRGDLELLIDAAEGSAQALAQLPAELRDLVAALSTG